MQAAQLKEASPKNGLTSKTNNSVTDSSKTLTESKELEETSKPPPRPSNVTAASKQRYVDVRDTYGKMSAKARGARLHHGPLKLRKSLPPRDCMDWIRSNKQYDPYSYFGNPNNKPAPVPKKPKAPPQMWLPVDPRIDRQEKEEEGKSSPSRAEEREKKDKELADRKPWNTEHHISMSRMNDEVQSGCREYFDRPKMMEGDIVPKLRERYTMNDRQTGWNDLTDAMGEGRRTVFNNLGPYNLGGCKQHQLPSYWRQVKDWGSYSAPNLGSLAGAKTGPVPEKKHLLYALANAPGHESKKFWKEWANNKTEKKNLMKTESDLKVELSRWDDNWSLLNSKANATINYRQREYFSVPLGGTGFEMPGKRGLSDSTSHPLATPGNLPELLASC